MKRLREVLLATACVLAALPACAQQGRQIDRLNVVLSADMRSSSPGVQRDGNSDIVLHHVVEGLVAPREDLSVAPMLARSWTVEDGGRTYRFVLRDDVTFHNGARLTSAEVVASWRRYLDPKTQWQCIRFFDGAQGPKIEAVEAPDARTVVFRIAEASALFLIGMANLQCNAAIVHGDSIGADGSWIAPIGTGPYRLADWQRGRFVELERFAAYSPLPGERDGLVGGKHGYAQKIRFQITPDTSVMRGALLSGDIDINPALSPSDIDDAKKRGIQVQVQSTLAWRAMLLQTQDPLLQDVRIRRAIAHSIDLAAIADAASFGLAPANPSAVPVASRFYNDKFKAWPAYDPAAARRLLTEAGYKGQPIRIQSNMRPGGYNDIAVSIQAMLAATGINAQIEVLDWATQLQNYLVGKFQMSSFAYSARLDPSLGYASVVGDKAKLPSAQWDDATARDLLDRAGRTEDQAARQALFEELHVRMAEAVPILGLYNDVLVTGAGPKVRGYKPWATALERYWGVWKD
ncbi:MAG: ABC transporter substrate-binding protein [Alphaproteobacteria bacterium]|jgi:peptide/nickel transport system substrate-binding protein|nr:ABC transporter substrate-binding protein [Alphaproteobacteria bacterium]